MLSTIDLENLINAKRREIMKEKTVLGLTSPQISDRQHEKEHKPILHKSKENRTPTNQISTTETKDGPVQKHVNFAPKDVLKENKNDKNTQNIQIKKNEYDDGKVQQIEPLHAELERYIRRYLGLPVMLKTGEYSPNNPLVRGTIPRGRDVFIGLGEYEHRSKTLRRLRQKEYKEYLDQQAKKKQEEKAQAERERRIREDREREYERLELERVNDTPHVTPPRKDSETERDGYSFNILPKRNVNTVDTAVQCDSGWNKPLSVGIQTDEADFYEMSTHKDHQLTQAERELSPRAVIHSHDDTPVNTARTAAERSSNQPRSDLDKSHSDFKRTYMPSIFDADAIHLRNIKAQQDAAMRRQYYQQDLKNQIEEQQRIREERKNREKMLEQAELRRLEEQLRALRAAQERETWKNEHIHTALKENTEEFNKKRLELQNDIEAEQRKSYRLAASNPPSLAPPRNIYTSKSDNSHNILPGFHKLADDQNKQSHSTSSVFSPNYDVDNYLRKNLNPSKESLMANRIQTAYTNNGNKETDNSAVSKENTSPDRRYSFAPQFSRDTNKHNAIEEKASSDHNSYTNKESKCEHSFLTKDIAKDDIDTLPIPVLRHLPKTPLDLQEYEPKRKILMDNGSHKMQLSSLGSGDYVPNPNSEAMQRVENKWKVPAVQKNIVKPAPRTQGKNGSILTQLGSIRRQLQLEQMRLDKLTNTTDHV